ncbi:Type III restriction-modification system methylation subunit [gamma proteobacterium IMCC1989]|nr:Type III restriction-modification system methylation subunit [gamma proteobacterium IMCC1989]
MYEIKTPSGITYSPPEGRCWGNLEAVFKKSLSENKIWFGKNGDSRPRQKNYLSEASGVKSWSWWSNKEAGHNQEAKKEINVLFGADNAFDTPKPERLMQRVLHIASNEGDLILDSFLGSASTVAVAHKMNRRYIGIELGEHAKTHCQPRLQKVVDGEQGGISKAVNWQGGGGFRFCKLGSTVFDEFGVLNHDIKFPTLAAHVWYIETRLPLTINKECKKKRSPLIGIHNETAYYLLYNGILGDKRPNGGNVLTGKILECLPVFEGKKVIYGETTRLGEARLKQENITFKQIPYDVKAL